MSTLHRGLSRSCSTLCVLALGCGGGVGDLFEPTPDNGGAGRGGQTGSVGGSSGAVAGGTGGQGGSLLGSGGAGASPLGAGGRGSIGSGGSGSGVTDGGAAGRDDAGAGAGPGPVCDPCPCSDGPFTEPELVSGLGVAVQSFGPAPSADGLTLFFSTIDAEEDIFVATRQNRDNVFSPALLVPGINDPDADDGTPFLTADGRSLFFFSTRGGPGSAGDRDLWVSTRPSAGAPFEAPSVVPDVNGPGLEHLPRVAPDGSLMFVSSRESENTGSNIFVAEPLGDGSFDAAVELPGVNGPGRDEGFWLSEDGLTVFFASNRVSQENMDIWVAVRQTASGTFGEPQPLEAVNTPSIEIDPALTPDGFELFFASDRSGTMQLYRSARRCP